jgi:hypothetical protein
MSCWLLRRSPTAASSQAEVAVASTFKRHTDECGDVTVKLEETYDFEAECDDKTAVLVKVTGEDGRSWKPKSPMCVRHDMDTAKGRSRAADDAVGFYEHYNCGTGVLDGARRRRRRKRR